MKKILKFGKIIVLCLVVLFASLPPMVTKANEEYQKKLLILGDTIATGYGLSDYNSKSNSNAQSAWSTLLADKYVAKKYNYAFDGCTTSDLRREVNRACRQENIKEADVICISVGGNDLMELAYEVVDNYTSLSAVNAGVEEVIDRAANNMEAIFVKINELNPKALVLVQTLYNPFQYWTTSAGSFSYDGTVGALIGGYIDDYNEMLKEQIATLAEEGFRCVCVDVAQKFQQEGDESWLNTKNEQLDAILSGINYVEGVSVNGVTVTPATNYKYAIFAGSTDAKFSVGTEKMTEGADAGTSYPVIKNITRGGWSKLTIAASSAAGLAANAEYTVTVEVVCDGEIGQPVYYEETATDVSNINTNDFVIYGPGGEIEFTVTTDSKGEFSKTWSTIYINAGHGVSSIGFTGVSLAKSMDNDFHPSAEGHYAIYETYVESADSELKEALGIIMDISEYRSDEKYTFPVIDGYVFAGWYSDSQLKKPIAQDIKTGSAYAKFVDEEVLSVKYQLTAGTEALSEKTRLRIVTTVDSLYYSSVGFSVELGNYGIVTLTTNKVYETLNGYVDTQKVSYQPKSFSDSSKYFMAYTITDIFNKLFEVDFTVTPIWETLDGTKVEGKTRIFSVNDELLKEDYLEFLFRDTVYLPEYFEKNDNFSNAELFSPSGELISMRDGDLYLDTLGTYKLVLHQSNHVYYFTVEDNKWGELM